MRKAKSVGTLVKLCVCDCQKMAADCLDSHPFDSPVKCM